MIWSIGTWNACQRAAFKGRPFGVKIPGSSEVLISPPCTRFTDATSNLGWFEAFWAANALIAAKAMADARQVFMMKPRLVFYPLSAILKGFRNPFRNPGSVGQLIRRSDLQILAKSVGAERGGEESLARTAARSEANRLPASLVRRWPAEGCQYFGTIANDDGTGAGVCEIHCNISASACRRRKNDTVDTL